jgi:hypothetical protein
MYAKSNARGYLGQWYVGTRTVNAGDENQGRQDEEWRVESGEREATSGEWRVESWGIKGYRAQEALA